MALDLATVIELVGGGFTFLGNGLTFVLAHPILFISSGISIAVGLLYKIKGAIG